jgi:hypothetical protein
MQGRLGAAIGIPSSPFGVPELLALPFENTNTLLTWEFENYITIGVVCQGRAEVPRKGGEWSEERTDLHSTPTAPTETTLWLRIRMYRPWTVSTTPTIPKRKFSVFAVQTPSKRATKLCSSELHYLPQWSTRDRRDL